MPSKRRSATDPPEPADSATTDATAPNEGEPERTWTTLPTPEGMAAAMEAARAADVDGYPASSDIEQVIPPLYVYVEGAPIAEGTATRSPNPLAGKRAYKVLQAIHHDGARIRPGEIVLLAPTSGLAKSPFVRLIEEDAPPANVAAAFDEADR